MSSGKRKLSFLGYSTGPDGGGGSPDDSGQEVVQLDDEMEKVFQREEPEVLDAGKLGDGTRRRSSLWRRRQNNSPSESTPSSVHSNVPSTAATAGIRGSDSDPAASGDMSSDTQSDRKVQFNKPTGESSGSPSTVSPVSDDMKPKPPRQAHQLAAGRKLSLQEEYRPRGTRRVSIQPEDRTLTEADAEDDTKPESHPKSSFAASDPERKQSTVSNIYRKMLAHNPHSVFVQLDELLCLDGGLEHEWKETARWIKYEEAVEEGSDRWGRPHVATLSFHSLLNLRRCLETGVVLLDLDEKDLPGVAYRVVEKMVEEELIEEEDKPVVMRSLLLRHRHVQSNDRGFRFSISSRKQSSYTSLQNLAAGNRRRSTRNGSNAFQLGSLAKNAQLVNQSGDDQSHKIDFKEETYTNSHEDLKKAHNQEIMKRIPEGAEATTVLVGAVGFLDQPTIAFVRLANAIFMPGITEVPIPVRFMFVLLGPSSAELDYHEVGRSIATLMSNPSFHTLAYKADDRKDLLSGINEFLDESIVLPPGNWEQKALLPFEAIKAKADQLRKRKKEAAEKREALQRAADLASPMTIIDDEKKALHAAELAELMPSGKKFDPLLRTGKLFGGVVNDIKRRYPYYISDFLDALNGQCIAATIFMYFAALSSAITFGGLLADKTGYQTGISETLVFTFVGGVIFAILSGQPMMITGATGPLLLFDESLYKFCISSGFDFLVARMFMGFWIMIIALCVAAAEGSVLVKRFTRFTEDIFASLISLIFILEPVTKLISLYGRHPLLPDYCSENETELDSFMRNITSVDANTTEARPVKTENQPNTALFCTLLTLGTFTIAYYLRIFRNGKFLGRSARRALGDFGVPIAIILMVALDFFVGTVYTDKLAVPAGLSPTNEKRPWFLFSSEHLPGFPIWAMFAMALPALMVYIIVFMETHIAELIVDKPERNLKKGSGFHMDIVVMSIINMVCGMFGAPWQCVATVRSVSHVSALTVMSTTHAPGEKPYIIEVKEQRITGLMVAILCGLSVLISNVLRFVPISVLFGVFLYMGISSINGIQLFDRIILFFKPVKHHPEVSYVKRVPTMRMHLFTFIQLICLGVLWTVKSSPISLAFPFFLIVLVPLRSQLSRIFTPMELRALDGKNQDIDSDDEPDFYQEAPLPG